LGKPWRIPPAVDVPDLWRLCIADPARQNDSKHEINDTIVQGGKIVLSHLLYVDGQHVRIIVAETNEPGMRISIQKLREILKGGVERFEQPFEPMIPSENWEMLK
jgi:hypothetical protein